MCCCQRRVSYFDHHFKSSYENFPPGFLQINLPHCRKICIGLGSRRIGHHRLGTDDDNGGRCSSAVRHQRRQYCVAADLHRAGATDDDPRHHAVLQRHVADKNALSVVAHVFAATTVVTITWAVVGYSLAFTNGNAWIDGLDRMFAEGLVGSKVGVHPSAPTVPESAFFLFQMAFSIISFALIVGATVERMRLSATFFFAGFWTLLVYAPVAHWIWQPTGWLAAMVVGPRKGFGTEPMVPHNLLISVIGAGLLWTGWFGFNAGSAFEASSRAVGAVLATQVAACVGAFIWAMCEFLKRGQISVLGMATGAIAGLIAVTPASGFVGVLGSMAIGTAAAIACFYAVTYFKSITKIDDTLGVFALHGVGGLVGTVLTPVFALKEIAPIIATVRTNLIGAVAVMLYAGAMTWGILQLVRFIAGLRVDTASEKVGLDASQHGEMLPNN